jgi:hypothetical protein
VHQPVAVAQSQAFVQQSYAVAIAQPQAFVQQSYAVQQVALQPVYAQQVMAVSNCPSSGCPQRARLLGGRSKSVSKSVSRVRSR